MSWDIYIQDLPAVPSIKDIPIDHVPRPIGSMTDLMLKIRTAIPSAEAEGTDWLFLREGDVDLSLQFHMEDAEQVRYLLIHIFSGEKAAEHVSAILKATGLRALDTRTGEFFVTI